MSYMPNTLIKCETLQDDLEALWQAEGAEGADEMIPLTEVLMSEANRRPIVQAILPGQGKKRVVEVKYTPRLTESEVNEDVDNPKCSSSTKSGELSSTYTMPDGNLGVDESFTAADFVDWCGNNGTRLLSRINAMADVLERKVATQFAQEFALLYGTWGNGLFTEGTAVGNVTNTDEYVWATRYSDGKPNPEAMGNLRIARMKAGLERNVVAFGGTDAYAYFQALGIGCCADSGMNLMDAMRQFPLGYAYDKRLEDALASSAKFMLYRIGAVQPLFYLANPWKDEMPQIVSNAATYIHTGISSPRLGMPMDLTINDTCGSGISVALAVSPKLIVNPADQFQSNDPYFGRNGVAKVRITNP